MTRAASITAWYAAVALVATAVLACGSQRAVNRPSGSSPIGMHSMLYLGHPYRFKEAMFRAAAAAGASALRLDVELTAVFPALGRPPVWRAVDQIMRLARRYRLKVLADLTATPDYMARCAAGTPANRTYECAGDPGAWGRGAGLIAAHTRGVIDDFEIVNEPDGKWAFRGSPQQYARMLSAAYDAIHAADPRARVALGGLMHTGAAGRAWMDAVLATPGIDAAHKFDIANLHVRAAPARAGAVVAGWRAFLAHRGFAGPLWVTETGYPADPGHQLDPAYRGGARAQARWLESAVPAMLRAGAAMVFVTERDQQTGPYASEGVLRTPAPLLAGASLTPRPAFYALRRLAEARASSGWKLPSL